MLATKPSSIALYGLSTFPPLLAALYTTTNTTLQNNAFSNLSNSLQGSAGRLTRMAQQGNKVAILKLAGIIIGIVLVLYWVGGWVFGGKKAG